jgi:hypothetical protein
MKRTLSLAVAALAITACHNPVDEYRDGVPNQGMVEIKLPARATAGLEEAGDIGQIQQRARGDRSEFYLLTRGATGLVNGGAVFVLKLIEEVTKHQPTTFRGNEAVWGPYTEDLSPNSWKLTVTRTGEKTFSYSLTAQGKNAPESAWVAILTGSHTAGDNRDVGSGEFLIDWDRAQTLPEHDDNIGTADITYSRDVQGAVTVAAQFRGVKDDSSGQRVDVDYRYSSPSPGQGGTFDFATWGNMDDGAKLEKLTIRSRWLATGAGRSDIKGTGGDLPAPATANECWDVNFASRYLAASWDASIGYGNQATDCAFPTPDYSSL